MRPAVRLLAALVLAVPVAATGERGAASAAVPAVGGSCGRDRDGQAALDGPSAQPIVCAADPDGVWRWRAGVGVVGLAMDLPDDAIDDGPVVLAGAHPAEGDDCEPDGSRVMSAATSRLMVCASGTWAELAMPAGYDPPPVPDLPDTGAPVPESLVPPPVVDPLPADLGDPTGLPPGVALPPGFVAEPGSPEQRESGDYWKLARWLNHGRVPGTDPEAVDDWFASQCASIGWIYDPRRTERLPLQNPPARGYDRSVQMVLGECRTVAGSPTDPTRLRPWYLAWGITARPGATQLDLVVELRSFPRGGGRAG